MIALLGQVAEPETRFTRARTLCIWALGRAQVATEYCDGASAITLIASDGRRNVSRKSAPHWLVIALRLQPGDES